MRRYGDIAFGSHEANGVALDSNGSPHVTGYSPGPTSGNDFATIKYDANGNEVWVERYNGPFNGDDQATAIAVDPAGAVYVAGFSKTSPTLTELVLIKYAELENIQRLENGTVRLQFFAQPGETVHFESSTNLPNWEPLGSSVTDPDGICRFVDTNASTFSQRFYRRVTSE